MPIFAVIERLDSFTLAVEALFLTHPRVSLQLKKPADSVIGDNARFVI